MPDWSDSQPSYSRRLASEFLESWLSEVKFLEGLGMAEARSQISGRAYLRSRRWKASVPPSKILQTSSRIP
jgi:hypothetical protein